LFPQLHELRTKKNEISEGLSAEYESRPLAIKAGIAELETDLQAFEDAAEDKWEDVNQTFYESADSLKE
jgi:hypothetical protein